jgi:chromosome segregation ATPase
MVKQGSFLQRLRDRWGTGSGVRVDRGGVAAAKATDRIAPVQRVEPTRHAPAPAPAPVREVATEFAPAEARSTRKMSDREEAMLALSTHFQELTSLLRGSQARVDDQLTRLVGATSALTQLPALSQQQLDTLRALSAHMERQNTLGEQLAGTMTQLPNMLQNVEAALARAAATDERTAATVREFQSTMDRIHTSMGQMVQHGEQHVRTAQGLAERRDQELGGLVAGMQQTQERAVSQLQRTTEDSLQSLRRTHEDQSNRLQRVVQEHAGWNRAVLVGIGLVVLGIGALIALQLFR